MSSGMMDDRTAARILGGSIVDGAISCPGPGHSRKDRSLRVWLRSTATGLIDINVYSHANDPWQTCKDYVAERLGLASDYWKTARPISPAEEARRAQAHEQAEARQQADTARRQRRAFAIWQEAQNPLGTSAEVYLATRALVLTEDIAGSVLRFHPRCPFGEGTTAPAMVAVLRCMKTGSITGIHRTGLTRDGQKIGRKMLGVAMGSAIMLDAEDAVSTGLNVGEGVESCLAARQLGLRPTWALGSTANLAALPVLPGVETLTLLGELGDSGASDRACTETGTRWHCAGRAVDIVLPQTGNDLNDVLKGGATTWR